MPIVSRNVSSRNYLPLATFVKFKEAAVMLDGVEANVC